MGLTIRNMNELQKILDKGMKQALNNFQKELDSVMNAFIKSFYDEYNPSVYVRTFQYLNSVCSSEIVKSGNGYQCSVRFNFDNTYYTWNGHPQSSDIVQERVLNGKFPHGEVALKHSVRAWNLTSDFINKNGVNEFKAFLIKSGVPVI